MTLAVATCAPWTLPTRHAQAQSSPVRCDAWQVEYALSATLELTDTPLRQGDGIHTVGPGTLVLRFDDGAGQPDGRVKMVSYEMRQAFTVSSRTLLGTTTVGTDATTREIPDGCGRLGEGHLQGTALDWTAPVRGFRTDGFLTCEGIFCGKFGAPPSGRSPLTAGPDPVQFKRFLFSADMKTFTMPSTFVSRTDSPRQTSHLTLAGRETARTCVRAPTCK
jgi:hypothetical protein